MKFTLSAVYLGLAIAAVFNKLYGAAIISLLALCVYYTWFSKLEKRND